MSVDGSDEFAPAEVFAVLVLAGALAAALRAGARGVRGFAGAFGAGVFDADLGVGWSFAEPAAPDAVLPDFEVVALVVVGLGDEDLVVAGLDAGDLVVGDFVVADFDVAAADVVVRGAGDFRAGG